MKVVLVLVVVTVFPRLAHAADLFLLDQRYSSIAFSVEHFGSFSSIGLFPRFMGRLLIDRAHPDKTGIM